MREIVHFPKIRTRKIIKESGVTYTGESQNIGANTANPVWKIERSIIGLSEDTSDFAGVDKFDAILDDRNDGITFPPLPDVSLLALKYDGLNDFVNVPDATLLRLEHNTPFTWAIWVNSPASIPFRALLSKLTNANVRGYEIGTNANKIRFQLANSVNNRTLIETVGAFSGRMHIVCVSDGTGLSSGLKIVINNVNRSVTNVQDDLLGNTIIAGNPLTFAARDNGNFYDMTQDNSQLFNKALTDPEISQLYAGGVVKDARNLAFANNLIEQWRFEDKGLAGLIKGDINTLNGAMINFGDIDAAFVGGL